MSHESKAMKEVIDVNVSFDTSFEDIELLPSRDGEFVRCALKTAMTSGRTLRHRRAVTMATG